MKALTLTQPWATLIAIGAKRIETRSWGTNYRGLLVIHAAKGLANMDEADLTRLCQREPFRSVLGYWGLGRDDLPRGAVVGTARLVSSTRMLCDVGGNEISIDWSRFPPHELAFGHYAAGRWAWVLEDAQHFIQPIPARGAQGLWDYTGPLETL